MAARRIVEAGIPLQISTLVTADTTRGLDETGKLAAQLGASRWSLFFLVPVGRGRTLRSVSARECEVTLSSLAARAGSWPFSVTTIEAPHYRRVVIERMREAGRADEEIQQAPIARSFGVRDGNGVMFIAANGDVRPSGFLPATAGNAREASPVEIYRDSPLFRALRSPERFHGRCGVCPFRSVCGGSRARAYAASGDILGADPLCAYWPVTLGAV